MNDNKSGQSTSTQDEARLHREVTIMRSVTNHPNIVKIYELLDSPSELFLFNEYCSGGELFDYICKKRRLSECEARSFFQQLIGAISHCHCHAICHRDLKPENIMLNEKKVVKLCDFGLSNFNEYGQFLRTFCGSPNYAAPEIVSGKPYVGPEVDVWSCGVILYAMLCGYLPFDDPSLATLFEKIKNGEFKCPAFLSTSVLDMIRKMIVVDPYERITLKNIRRHAWFDTSVQSIKMIFSYGPLPPLSSVVKRRHLLTRYGIPHYTKRELKDLFELENAGSMIRRTWDNLARSWVLSARHLAKGLHRDEDTTQRGLTRGISLTRGMSQLIDSDKGEEVRKLLDPPKGFEDIDPEVLANLHDLGYDVAEPTNSIDPVLRPDVNPTPETVAYHLLMDARRGNSRIPLQTAAYVGVAHLCINAHGLPGDVITDRQKAVMEQKKAKFLALERSDKTFEPSHLGVYNEAAMSQPDELQPEEQSEQPKTEDSAAFKLLPVPRLKPQEWGKFPMAFPKDVQRKAAACAVFKNDLDEPTVQDMCPLFRFITPRRRRKKDQKQSTTAVPEAPHTVPPIQKLAEEEATTMVQPLPHPGPFDPSMKRRRSKLPYNRGRGRQGDEDHLQQRKESLKYSSYSESPGIIMVELMRIISESGYEWKPHSYGKWIVRKKREATTTQDELLSLAANVAENTNFLPSVWGDMTFLTEFSAQPVELSLVMMIQFMRLTDELSNGIVRHFVDVLHLNGPVNIALTQSSKWITSLNKAMRARRTLGP